MVLENLGKIAERFHIHFGIDVIRLALKLIGFIFGFFVSK